MIGIIKSIVVSCLFLIYPYLIYKGLERGLVWVAPVIFSIIYLIQALATNNLKIKISKILLAISLLLGAYYLQTLTAKILPVLIQLMLMYFFGRTLLQGNGPPFIECFVRLDYPEFPPGIEEYCRQLTITWVVFFAVNALIGVCLAIWQSDYWWAIYNGVIIYMMIAGLMIAEYIYRHFRFPNLEIPSPLTTMKSMMTNGRKIWQEMQAR